MNKLLCLLLLLVTTLAYSQNKTLGVGTTTPNPNAALHVESPTNNQGFIMPRLTTTQKTAMGSILAAGDEGVMVYDTDIKAIQIWSGSAWTGLAKLQYPYVDTITTLPAGGNALRLVYNSTDAGNFGVAHFENMNPNSGFTPLFVRTNSATNGATDMIVNNASNTNDVIGATTNGLGTAGNFRVNNAVNDSSALQATTNGTGRAVAGYNTGNANAGFFRNTNPAATKHALHAISNGDTLSAAIHGENIGNGFGVFGKSSGTDFATAAVYGEHVGTGDAAGAFRISNPASIYSGLYGETNGSGPAIYGQNIGTGRAANFTINNPASTAQAIRVITNGMGSIAQFSQTNAANTAHAVLVNSTGASGIFTNHNGTTGYAGIFQNINTANTTPALYAEAAGAGASIWALKSTDAIGGDALFAENWIATGSAATFSMTDASNTSAAVNITTAGPGNAITANAPIQATQFIGDGSLLTGVGGGFALPRVDSVATPTGTADLFAIKYNNAEPKRLLRVHSINPSNGSSAVSIRNDSWGLGLYVQNANDTASNSTIYATTNSNAGGVLAPVGVYGESTGTGSLGGVFRTTNVANTYPALVADGFGEASAFVATNNNASLGNAGTFQIVQPGNSGSAVSAQTSGTGPALQLNQTNGGYALDVINGGLKMSVLDVDLTNPVTMDAKAAVYNITTGTSNLTLGTTGRVNGETVYVTSEVAGIVAIDGLGPGGTYTLNISGHETATFIFINGTWRTLGAYAP